MRAGKERSGPCVWLIAGPTASGKSTLAMRLASEIGAEVINADSMQVYRDLSVLTARPTSIEMSGVPHHLFGAVDGAQAWSVGRWVEAVKPLLARLARDGKPVVLVGGTGLYFNALTDGLSDIPAVPSAVRSATAGFYDQDGEAAFRARLSAVDPAAEARIEFGDRQRLCRAYEVWTSSGRSLSAWQGDATPVLDAWRGVVLDPQRPVLYARCDARVTAMIEGGALAEVAVLMARNLDPALPVMKALGVPEFSAHFRGEITLDAAIAATRQSTRNYAKRQMTWFRGRAGAWPRICAADPAGQWAELDALVRSPELRLNS